MQNQADDLSRWTILMTMPCSVRWGTLPLSSASSQACPRYSTMFSATEIDVLTEEQISFAFNIMGLCSSIATTFNTPLLFGGPSSVTWCWLIGSCMCMALGTFCRLLNTFSIHLHVYNPGRCKCFRNPQRVPHLRRNVRSFHRPNAFFISLFG